MLYIGLIVTLGLALVIETTSWSIKAYSKPEFKGIFVAKTNIYLYGARLFLLLYTVGLSYLVDSKMNIYDITFLVSISYLFSALLHGCILNNKFHIKVCEFFMKIIRIQQHSRRADSNIRIFSNSLALKTAASSFFFTISMAAPYISASLFPDFRMTFSAVGQIINSFGTIILLFFVDPVLYKLMDSNNLMESLYGYYVGRIFGFTLGGIFLALMAVSFD